MSHDPEIESLLNRRFPLLGGQHNLRAKLRNSLADLRWYAFRMLLYHGFGPVQEKEALHRLYHLKKTFPNALPGDLEILWAWVEGINLATPDNAQQTFNECWQFLHNSFDPLLNK